MSMDRSTLHGPLLTAAIVMMCSRRKLAANYLAFIKLAAIRIWLRAYESTP